MTHHGKLLAAGALLLLLLVAAYLNHFDNGFYFDDAHTILNNGNIRDLRNIPRFFTDASTFSSLPANQAYRPMVTTLNAIDYWLGGGLNPFVFHLSIFLAYVLQAVLLFFVFRRILDRSLSHEWNGAIALASSAFYTLHAANAETINYIISRSDAFSTLCIVAALFLFQLPATRRIHLYLLPMVVGIETKQTGLMFAPLLFLYLLLFEEEPLAGGPAGALRAARRALRASAAAWILGVSLFLMNQLWLTPASTVSSNAEVGRFDYLLTQAFVLTHYLGNFFLPLWLSADPDFGAIRTAADPRVLFGLAVVAALALAVAVTVRRPRTRPIAFGILWFFVGLAPTSSLIPLYQMANDHRTFLPYIGLALALGWLVGLGLMRHRAALERSSALRRAVLAAVALVLVSHAYGTYRRNVVWGSDESLWHDVTLKSPGNGRGLMNYGLSQMERGNYEVALDYYQRALELLPHYSYLQINLAILKNAMGRAEGEVAGHFEAALRDDPSNPAAYSYYADWLSRRGRNDEARDLLRRGLELSPEHAKMRALAASLDAAAAEQGGAEDVEHLERAAEARPTPEAFLNLSLAYYRAGNYERSLAAARSALRLKPDYAEAYNNACCAHNRLAQWDRAIEACNAALALVPDYERARANLRWAEDGKRRSPAPDAAESSP